ncbi:jm1 protein [Anaeramoeba flamelloides]|uniref:Jm1 protein n=1 Tax=Anaeramoeba flamelloides TaxID=1746091 RepID=A0ABQ8YRV8_9EUKA|nr:jm1 protein [Anaeramoeba flamelloides]
MESVDEIIIHSLNQLGLKIDEGSTISDLTDPDFVLQVTSICLKLIDPEIDIPKKMPSEISLKYRIGQNLSQTVKDLGYRNEIGYHFFLYPDASDLRKFFLWLVESLPKTEEVEYEEDIVGSARIYQNITFSLQEWSKKPISNLNDILDNKQKTKKPFKKFETSRLQVPTDHDMNKEIVKSYCEQYLDYVSGQTTHIAESVIEHNDEGVVQQQEESELASAALDAGEYQQDYLKKQQTENYQTLNNALQVGGTFFSRSSTNYTNFLSNFENSRIEFRAFNLERNQGSRFSNTSEFGQKKSNEEKTILLEFEREVLGKTKEEEERGKEKEKKKGKELLKEKIQEKMDPELAMENLKKTHEEKVNKIRMMISEMNETLDSVEIENKNYTDLIMQLKNQFTEEIETIRESEKEIEVKKKVINFLPKSEENISKLRQLNNQTCSTLVDLAGDWEKFRADLIKKIRELKQNVGGKKEMWKVKIEKIKVMRNEMKDLVYTIKEKEGVYKQLIKEFKKLPKNIHRANYTKRIIEIVKNVKKQKTGITKILSEIHDLQNKIHLTNGNISRSFGIADETLYKAAQNDLEKIGSKNAYLLVVEIHNIFSEIRTKLQNTGKMKNQISQLETEIELMKTRDTTLNMKKIQKDLEMVKKENKMIKKKFSKLKPNKKSSKKKKK